jgi:hypothetical protein
MDKFNENYREFLEYITQKFPTYQKYATLIQNPGKRYLNDFIEFNLPHIEHISMRNCDIFRYKLVDAQLIRGLTFKRVFDRIYDKPQMLESIWRYLHKLYIVSYNSCDLSKMIDKKYNNYEQLLLILENHNAYVENIMLSGHPIIEKSESSSESEEDISDEEAELRRQFEKMRTGENVENSENKNEDNVEENTLPNISNMFEGSIIGELAKELSSEIDLNDLGSMGNMGDIVNSILNPNAAGSDNKLQNIIKSVTEKMDAKMKNGELTQEQLLNDAQNMMGNMGQLFAQSGVGGAGGNNDMLANMMRQMGMMAGMSAGNGGGGNSGTGNNRSSRRRRDKRMNKRKH